MTKWDQFRAAEYDLPTAEDTASKKSDQIRILEAERAKPGLTAEDYAGIDRELARAKGLPVPSKFIKYAEPASAGGGRGGQGGPTAEQNFMRTGQSTTTPEEVSKAKVASNKQFVSDLGSDVTAFTAGIGKGVSLGATDYLAAVPMKIMNGGSYEDALANVRAINKIQEAEHPKSAFAGEITGDIITAAATGNVAALGTKALGVTAKYGAKTAVNVAGQASAGATTAAVKEALTNPDATPTTITQAAGIGALGAGIGAGIGEGIAGATSKFVNKNVAKINAPMEKAIKEANEAVPASIAADKARQKTLDELVAKRNIERQQKWVSEATESGPMRKKPSQIESPKLEPSSTSEPIVLSEGDLVTPTEYRRVMAVGKQEPSLGAPLPQVPSQMKALASGAKEDVGSFLTSKLPQTYGDVANIATAAALGSGAYMASSENQPSDILPWSRELTTGAAALVGLKSHVVGNALLRQNLYSPRLAEIAARLSGQVAGNIGSEYATPQEPTYQPTPSTPTVNEQPQQIIDSKPTNVPSAISPSKWSQYEE